MHPSESDFGNLIQTCFPKKSKFFFNFLLPAVLFCLAGVFVWQGSQVPTDDPFAHVKIIIFLVVIIFMVICAVFLTIHHIESMTSGRLDFYENGIIFQTMNGVIPIPAEKLKSIEPLKNSIGKFHCLTLTDDEKVLISCEFFGPEIKDHLYSYLPKAE